MPKQDQVLNKLARMIYRLLIALETIVMHMTATKNGAATMRQMTSTPCRNVASAGEASFQQMRQGMDGLPLGLKFITVTVHLMLQPSMMLT